MLMAGVAPQPDANKPSESMLSQVLPGQHTTLLVFLLNATILSPVLYTSVTPEKSRVLQLPTALDDPQHCALPVFLFSAMNVDPVLYISVTPAKSKSLQLPPFLDEPQHWALPVFLSNAMKAHSVLYTSVIPAKSTAPHAPPQYGEPPALSLAGVLVQRDESTTTFVALGANHMRDALKVLSLQLPPSHDEPQHWALPLFLFNAMNAHPLLYTSVTP
eukprot:CAMPEP_0115666060 /NCGR_PEP_ID=MMETSP0272-20121206/49215_1 /TAXON_ID=71861 /ORGANISM="Scrippsiella trochoidea, Strain CCMP3099" /LENGTH=216 /DNA_ID=CAMNT_0003104535 /DNA_START=91 /DNA_END=738 /DNA_ORIENTATION=+